MGILFTTKAAARPSVTKRLVSRTRIWQRRLWQQIISIIKVNLRLGSSEPFLAFKAKARSMIARPAESIFALILLLALAVNFSGKEQWITRAVGREGFGGPESEGASLATTDFADGLLDGQRALGGAESVPDDFAGYFFVFEDSVGGWQNPVSEALSWIPKRDEIIVYPVEEGDSPSRIADHFGISVNTILWANNLSQGSVIRPGQQLVILPVSGVLHEVKSGDTISQIAKTYGIPESRIVAVNSIEQANNLVPGEKLIVPGAQPAGTRTTVASAPPRLAAVEVLGYFRAPTTGWNWGRLHNYNAIDIANACGTPVYAAAAGFIGEAKIGGWNSGYGNFIDISHENGTKTRYAHLSAVLVSAGAYVNQGDLIGSIGRTGKTHGVTGCHLHFEVRGGRNPFVRN
jgi:LysM repeat protein